MYDRYSVVFYGNNITDSVLCFAVISNTLASCKFDVQKSFVILVN